MWQTNATVFGGAWTLIVGAMALLGDRRAISAATTLAVFAALNAGMHAVLTVFGIWAILSGGLQFGTALRRWKQVGAQWAMILSGARSLRDVIAFPKSQRAVCLLTDAPSSVDAKQLKELGIKVVLGD